MRVKCPNCGEVIDLSESDSAAIINQVRNAEFETEIAEYKKRFETEKESALKMAEIEATSRLKDALAKKDEESANLRVKIESNESEKQLAVAKATSDLQTKINELNTQVISMRSEAQIAVTQAVSEKQLEVTELKAKLASTETSEKLAITEALSEADKKYAMMLKSKEEELEAQKQETAYYKDLKARMSTKAIGESLEIHCQDSYDMYLRSLLPTAYFEKDNDISETGSKGDYIFREDKDGIPLLSIMFEMKTEMETTENKHKNDYFFKELDKDRREKGCEYAVLVSLLESDSEYYNQGIVDVSHRYPKMYVIRPQFLVPLITLLRNAALNSHSYRTELTQIKDQNIDVTNFESDLGSFKIAFSKSCELTGKSFNTAITQIDKAIRDLEGVKDALIASGKHLIAADNKLEDLTVKKLTRKNPTMKAKFEEARSQVVDLNDTV